MKTTGQKWAVKAAGAGALVLVLATPSFAQSRDGRRSGSDRGRTETNRTQNDHRDDNDRSRGTYNNRNDRQSSNRSYRDNDRVTVQGRVTSFSRERDGYRVRLDHDNYSYWVPQSYFRNRNRGLSIGVSLGFGGIFRGGSIFVDAVNYPGDRGYDSYGYNNGYSSDYVAGRVERIDFRNDTMWMRDDRGGQLIAIDMRGTERDRLDPRDLRPGDYVSLSGQWQRGGVFSAYRIDDIRSGRY